MHTLSEKSELKGVADRGHEREDAELFEDDLSIWILFHSYLIGIHMVIEVVEREIDIASPYFFMWNHIIKRQI